MNIFVSIATYKIRVEWKRKKDNRIALMQYGTHLEDVEIPKEPFPVNALLAAISKLNKRPRQILELMLQGESTKKISTLLDTSEQTIWNQRVSAYKILRQQLDPFL